MTMSMYLPIEVGSISNAIRVFPPVCLGKDVQLPGVVQERGRICRVCNRGYILFIFQSLLFILVSNNLAHGQFSLYPSYISIFDLLKSYTSHLRKLLHVHKDLPTKG